MIVAREQMHVFTFANQALIVVSPSVGAMDDPEFLVGSSCVRCASQLPMPEAKGYEKSRFIGYLHDRLTRKCSAFARTSIHRFLRLKMRRKGDEMRFQVGSSSESAFLLIGFAGAAIYTCIGSLGPSLAGITHQQSGLFDLLSQPEPQACDNEFRHCVDATMCKYRQMISRVTLDGESRCQRTKPFANMGAMPLPW